MYVNMYVCTHICTFYHISPYPHDIPVASTPIPATPSASPRHAERTIAAGAFDVVGPHGRTHNVRHARKVVGPAEKEPIHSVHLGRDTMDIASP